MNNNISFSFSENWNNNNISGNNNNNSSMVSFVGNNNPFNINPQTSIFDFSSLTTSLSSSPSFANFTTPNSQFADYPSADLLKQEEESYLGGNGGRIGLNLGHRTYFSSRETALVDRLFRRPRGFYQGNQVPRCQAEGCKMDLTNAKHYHRRHKVCEFHSKATKVVAGGLEQRFCQQCSRFHLLAEFDQAKRSCRKRLADHNRRRRKTQQQQQPSSSSSSTSVSTKININAENVKAFSQATNSTSEVLKEITSTTDDHHQRRLIFNQLDSTDHHFFHRSDHNNSLAAVYQNHHPLFSDASLATRGGGGSEQSQHSDELQNLLRLRQTMSEVELL